MSNISMKATIVRPSLAYFEQPNGNTKCSAGTPQRPLVIRYRPRILREILQDARELKFAL